MRLRQYGLWLDIGLKARPLNIDEAIEIIYGLWARGLEEDSYSRVSFEKYKRVAFAIYKHGTFQGNAIVYKNRVEFTGSKAEEDVWNTFKKISNEAYKLFFGLGGDEVSRL